MQVKKLWSRTNQVILVWPGEEPLELAYDNVRVVVPSRFETAKPGRDSIYRHESARTASGDLIPGSVVVEDIVNETEMGGFKTVFNVNDMCQYFVRERNDLFAQGFNIVSSVSEIPTAMELGLPLYEASQDERARIIVSNEMARQKKQEDRGEGRSPAPNPQAVMWAVAHLKNRQAQKPQFSANELRDVLEGRFVEQKAPATVPAPQPTSASSLYDEARSLDITLNKTELQGILENDAAQIAFVRQKIELRRQRLVEEAAAKDTAANAAAG